MTKQKIDSESVSLEQRTRIEREVLLPILDEIAPKQKSKLYKLNIPSYEVVGLIIAETRSLKSMVKNQRKTILKLREKAEKIAQMSLLDLLKATAREIGGEP